LLAGGACVGIFEFRQEIQHEGRVDSGIAFVAHRSLFAATQIIGARPLQIPFLR
jgi:hypothetical protein